MQIPPIQLDSYKIKTFSIKKCRLFLRTFSTQMRTLEFSGKKSKHSTICCISMVFFFNIREMFEHVVEKNRMH